MLPPYLPNFVVNHGGVHSRCKQKIKISDLRISTYDSLKMISEPYELCCSRCAETFTSTTLDVWLFVNLSAREIFYELPVEQVLDQRTTLEAEYQRGLNSVRNR
jgi:hypothetical protein